FAHLFQEQVSALQEWSGDGAAAGPAERSGRRKDGLTFPLEMSVSRWATQEGDFFSALMRDISERKQAETALVEAHQDLERRVEERTRELSHALEDLQKAN